MMPQTIQIFLPNGNPRGLKIAELTNRLIKAVYFPRKLLNEAVNRSELKNVGLYFLFGDSIEDSKQIVYIGEAEDCLKRIRQHSNKNFWNFAIVFISKTNSFTKAHVKYLEYLAIQKANNSIKFKLENSVSPKIPNIPETIKADLNDNFETINILSSTLGFSILDSEANGTNEKEIFYNISKGISAKGKLTDDGFIVYKNSEISPTTAPSCHKSFIELRRKLITNGIIINQNDKLVFKEDYLFKSPSSAAGIIMGRSANGWSEWKNKDNVTLDEFYRKNETK